jgi:transposase InsO family protein
MGDLLKLIWYAVAGLFRSRAALQTEVLALRHQLNVLRRRAPKRVAVSDIDRLVFAGLYHLAPEVLDAVKILKPETIIRWHRAGFRAWWRWKSRPRGGRPRTPDEIRQLIREMSVANPLWGAPRIHGELLKLGMDVGQTTVAKYMAKRRRPPSQGWRTFVHNHADAIASIDMFVVPTISFGLLYGLLILRQSRRELLWLGVTAHPNAEWLARQLTEACGWDEPPRYLIRDRDGAYGAAFIRRIRAMGIRDRPVSARSPWQNGYAERLIGSIRRECLDHVVVVGERHLRHVLASYQKYFCNGPGIVKGHLSTRESSVPPGSCFCSGSARGRHLMGFEEDRSANLRARGLCHPVFLRPDLIHRPGVGTSLREGWCPDPPESPSISLLL